MTWPLLRGCILSMQILLSTFDIDQSHVGVVMTKQTHQGGQADTGPQHGGGIGVPKLMRDDVPRNPHLSGGFLQTGPQGGHQSGAAVWPWQQKAGLGAGGQRT